MLAVYAALPTVGGVVNYPRLWTPDLVSLSAWARASSPKEAMFHFPDAGRALYPGMFRYDGKRAIVFGAKDRVPLRALRHCIGLALTHHLRKK